MRYTAIRRTGIYIVLADGTFYYNFFHLIKKKSYTFDPLFTRCCITSGALYDQVCGKLRDLSHTVSGVRVSSDEVYNPH